MTQAVRSGSRRFNTMIVSFPTNYLHPCGIYSLPSRGGRPGDTPNSESMARSSCAGRRAELLRPLLHCTTRKQLRAYPAVVCSASWQTLLRSWPSSKSATRRPLKSCSNSSMTSCGSWLRLGWPPNRPGRLCRPRHWSTRRTSDWLGEISPRVGAAADTSSPPRRPCAASWSKKRPP